MSNAAWEAELSQATMHHPPSGGQFLTLPDAEALFQAQQEERAAHQADEMAKKVEKETAARSQELEHAQNAIEKTFTAPLTSYKHKDGLKDIAAAFALDQMGTTSDLITRCQDHLLAHPDLQSNPRFTGLFSQQQTRHCKLVLRAAAALLLHSSPLSHLGIPLLIVPMHPNSPSFHLLLIPPLSPSPLPMQPLLSSVCPICLASIFEYYSMFFSAAMIWLCFLSSNVALSRASADVTFCDRCLGRMCISLVHRLLPSAVHPHKEFHTLGLKVRYFFLIV